MILQEVIWGGGTGSKKNSDIVMNMQDLPESLEETELTSEQAVTQLSSPVELMNLSPLQLQKVQEINDKLSSSALYSGVEISCTSDRALEVLTYNIISVDDSVIDFKTVFTTVAQSRAYPESPPAAGSQPFVIAVFISGKLGNSSSILLSRRGPVDIVDDIIKPFLPQSAPHLVHIPKLFFISSRSMGPIPASPERLLLPDDKDGNYLIAHCVTDDVDHDWLSHIAFWMCCSYQSVQDIVEQSRSRSLFDPLLGNEHLQVYCCLKDDLVLK